MINALETRDIKAYSHSLGLHGGEGLLAPLPQTPSFPAKGGKPPLDSLFAFALKNYVHKHSQLSPNGLSSMFPNTTLPQFAPEGGTKLPYSKF